MFEIRNIKNARKKMKKTNVIIYSTIQNCEEHFLNSISNIELLSNCFNSVSIIIVEYDSNDNTRQILKKWMKTDTNNIIKYYILLDNLDKKFPLHSQRIAYCNNKILDYIFTKKMDKYYQYAIHCNFDNTLWSIDFDGFCNCFQYDLSHWDVITCVNKNNTYYDFSSLRCENTWFNKNIFSCETKNINYETKTDGFIELLKNTIGPLKVQSSFNGFGIYKLDKLKSCYYDVSYKCNMCNGNNTECQSDNHHVGFHKSLILKNGINYNIFINQKMQNQIFPIGSITYEKFIQDMTINIPNLNKNILLHLLINDLIDITGLWLEFGTGKGFITNQISHYSTNTLYSFDSFQSYPYRQNGVTNNITNFSPETLNNNVELVKGSFSETIPKFKKIHLKNITQYISFLYIDCDVYQSTCQIFENLYNTITNNCIIVFGKFVNYPNYHLHALKSFYEFVQKYKIKFEWIGINGVFSRDLSIKNENFSDNDDKTIAIKIINNPYFNEIEFVDTIIENNVDNFELRINSLNTQEYNNFNWEKYKYFYPDLNSIETKKDAWFHWKINGIKEGRTYFHINETFYIKEIFDWEKYIDSYPDLSCLKTQADAWNHWINSGIIENRIFYQLHYENKEKKCFDWIKYKNTYADLSSIHTKEIAWEHWENNGKSEGREYFFTEYDVNDKPNIPCINPNTYPDTDFNWKLYIAQYKDLSHITNENDALNHWINHGKEEGRVGDFDWCQYIVNLNLASYGLDTKEDTLNHWIENGKKRYQTPYDFNWSNYIRLNIDLHALIMTESEAIHHWLNHGINENRNYK